MNPTPIAFRGTSIAIFQGISPTSSITVFSKIIAIFCFSTSSPHNSLVKIVPKLWLQAIAPEIIELKNITK